jgi:hypothetical protein
MPPKADVSDKVILQRLNKKTPAIASAQGLHADR